MGPVPSLCMNSALCGSVDVMYCLLCRGLWVRIPRKACWLTYCKMCTDAVGHPGIFGILHLTQYILRHTKSFSAILNSMGMGNSMGKCHLLNLVVLLALSCDKDGGRDRSWSSHLGPAIWRGGGKGEVDVCFRGRWTSQEPRPQSLGRWPQTPSRERQKREGMFWSLSVFAVL